MGYNQAAVRLIKPKRNHFWSRIFRSIQQINPVGDYLYLLGHVPVTLAGESVGSKYGAASMDAKTKTERW